MFEFFRDKSYWHWSILGSLVILGSVWYSVQLDVEINTWFGSFYDMLQKALASPNAVTIEEFYGSLYTFFEIAAIYIVVNVIFNGFFVNHYCFRWRKAMADYYQQNWQKARKIEGASQRVQEDTLKFARLTEDLGVGLLESILMLIAFVPILYGLSKSVTELPYFGEVDHGLVWVALTTALGGTVLLSLVGSKLPGIEYDIQKEEASYRKELVYGEDDENKADNVKIFHLFQNVQTIHYKSYLHYFYFNIAKWSYLQGMVIVPYAALAPTIVAGGITLGIVSQTVRAFGKVAESLQYIIRSWLKIVELISVWKRLREFEKQFKS
jgi:peptide/bleomycin uptake transporter